jgi:hypothetical protein
MSARTGALLDKGSLLAMAVAVLQLGALLREQGDLEGAKRAFRKAIDSGHTSANTELADLVG